MSKRVTAYTYWSTQDIIDKLHVNQRIVKALRESGLLKAEGVGFVQMGHGYRYRAIDIDALFDKYQGENLTSPKAIWALAARVGAIPQMEAE